MIVAFDQSTFTSEPQEIISESCNQLITPNGSKSIEGARPGWSI